MMDDQSKQDQIVWDNLVRWVQQEPQPAQGAQPMVADETMTPCGNNHDDVGYVHPDLSLQRKSGRRGVFCTQAIPQGTLLFRIPSHRVLSGEGHHDASCSDWLKCVMACYQAFYYDAEEQNHNDDDSRTSSATANHYSSKRRKSYWDAYRKSLPQRYDTLYNWAETQLDHYLAGTTLHSLMHVERTQHVLSQKYRSVVKPHLQHLVLSNKNHSTETTVVKEEDRNHQPPSSQQEAPVKDETTKDDAMMESHFQTIVQCISTRGFHCHPPNDNETVTTSDYTGPFLIPLIDLLNHDAVHPCTTLQRDTNNAFYMKAERDVAKGDELLHSYVDESSLTASQFLQTFGFVPHSKTKAITTVVEKTLLDPAATSFSPATLSKGLLLDICEEVKRSSYPHELQRDITRGTRSGDSNDSHDDTDDGHLQRQGKQRAEPSHQSKSNDDDDDEEEDLWWELSSIPKRPLDDDVSHEWLVSSVDDPFPGEFVTFLCAQFLPSDAYYEEIATPKERIKGWLDKSVLEDFYLGSLVLHTMERVLIKRYSEYTFHETESTIGGSAATGSEVTATTTASHKITSMRAGKGQNTINRAIRERQDSLKMFVESQQPLATADDHHRQIAGKTVQLEELLCLSLLERELQRLRQLVSPSSEGEYSLPEAKRPKVDGS